ncbi:MAG: hypothetical protein B6U97_04930 [Candidatus Altiarchaeales archaeon ex4484_96]|nr:MAG: hypothetical protein B6U97_04930 [Candidatus Altiarchaeales archaeon ex4484_96]
MKKKHPIGITIILLLASNTKAYIDPGTGSMIFQMLIASLVGLIFMLKLYWKNLKNRIKKQLNKNPNKKKNE